MIFKEWFLNEDVATSQFFYKLSLYPTDAFDGAESFADTRDIYAMQKRWKTEAENGRPFYNIDRNEYLSKKSFNVHSQTMPDAKPGFWRHKSKERPNLEFGNANLMSLGVGKNSKTPTVITKHNPGVERDLDGIFGDNIPPIEPLNVKKFDKPFRKVRENFTPFSDISSRDFSNKNLGVRSKYVGPDDTGENEPEKPVPVANFGFGKRRKKAYIQDKLGRPYVEPHKPNHHL